MEELSEQVILNLPADIHKLCRTCLSVANESLQPYHDILIYNEYNTLTGVAEMLHSCSSIKIKPEEGLPMSICDECASKLEIAFNFKHQCEKTDASLRKLMDMPPTESTLANISIKKELEENLGNNTNSKNIIYENSLHKNEEIEILEQIDLTEILSQRDTLIERYILNDDTEIQNSHTNTDNINKEYIYTLIQERKMFCEENNFEERKEVHLLKQERDSDPDIETSYTEFLCSICQKSFESQEHCEDHFAVCSQKTNKTENDDSGENFPPFECHICSKKFKSRFAKKTHLKIHEALNNTQNEENGTSDELFYCNLCDKGYRTEVKLASHFYYHAKLLKNEQKGLKITVACNTCKENFSSSLDFFEHLKTRHEEHGKITCQLCMGIFDAEIPLIIHLKKHNIHIHFCKFCVKKFDSLHKFKIHERSHTLDHTQIVFKCPICKEEFNSTKTLSDHSLVHLADAYKCDKCRRTFHNVISFENHQKQHAEPKFLCSICGKQYFNKVTLAGHVRSHNNEKPFICSYCNKGFSSRATLSVHRRIHSSFKPYICSYCGYSCRQSGDLAMHIRTHTGDKPYKCTFPNCDRKFTTSSQRREHYRRHTNERNHKCKVCGKAFLESKTLKVHMLTHTGEKPHCCEICGKKFRRSHHLASHVKQHTNFTVEETTQIVNIDFSS